MGLSGTRNSGSFEDDEKDHEEGGFGQVVGRISLTASLDYGVSKGSYSR